MDERQRSVDGVRVVELAGLGPSQHGAMLLADLGADVVRVDRPAHGAPDRDAARRTLLNRGRRSIALDLKDGDDREVALRLADGADVLVDPYRPGARAAGPGPRRARRPQPPPVVARMTGWGQDGPRAGDAGHDIDYIAAAGALHSIGPAGDVPVVPLNLVADFGGGGMLLAFGIAAALVERERSGRGQVIDVAMVDGVASLMNFAWQERALARWTPERGSTVQGAAPWYRAYATADGTFVAVGAYEPRFYATLLERLGLDPAAWPQWDRDRWATLSGVLVPIFASRTAEDWERELAGADVCFARVRSLDDVFGDPHMAARGSHVERDGLPQAGVVPRFGRTRAGSGARRPGRGSTMPSCARSSAAGRAGGDVRDEVVEVALVEHAAGAGLEEALRGPLVRASGVGHDLEVLVLPADEAGGVRPVEARHLAIDDDEVERHVPEHLDRRGSVAGLGHDLAAPVLIEHGAAVCAGRPRRRRAPCAGASGADPCAPGPSRGGCTQRRQLSRTSHDPPARRETPTPAAGSNERPRQDSNLRPAA